MQYKKYLVDKEITKSIRAGMHVLFGQSQFKESEMVLMNEFGELKDKQYTVMTAIGEEVQHLFFKEMYQNYFKEGRIISLE